MNVEVRCMPVVNGTVTLPDGSVHAGPSLPMLSFKDTGLDRGRYIE